MPYNYKQKPKTCQLFLAFHIKKRSKKNIKEQKTHF